MNEFQNESSLSSFLSRIGSFFKEYFLPILAISIPFIIHIEGKRLSETQIEISKQQFRNDLETKYLEIFYNDLTSKDSMTRLNSVSLLNLMNDSLAQKLDYWVKNNPNIGLDVKALLTKNVSIRNRLPNKSFGPINNKISDKEEGIANFFRRIELGDTIIVKEYLNAGLAVNQKNEDNLSPLRFALNNGDFAMFKFLVKNKANLHEENENGYNFLHLVISNNVDNFNQTHLDWVKWFLKHGFTVKNNLPDGTKPLMLAIPGGENSKDDFAFEIIKILINAGADPCIEDMFRYHGTTTRIVDLIKSYSERCK